MKRLKKLLLSLAIAWISVHMIPSADCVEAKSVTINTDKSSITMKNASWQGAASLEVSVENQPVGSTMVITLGNSQVINLLGNEDDEKKLCNTMSFTKKANEDDEDEEENEKYLDIIPLMAGESSVIINVYSGANEILATKTIPVVVNDVTPELYRTDSVKNKTYKLAQTSKWTCEVGNWSSGEFKVCNVPFGSKVTISVNKKNMYKRTDANLYYQWKKMKKNSYTLKEDTYISYWDEAPNYEFILNPLKKGNTKITITITTGDKVTTYVIKNKIESYTNPLKKLVINGKNKTKAYNKEQYLQTGTNLESKNSLNMYETDNKKVTGQITMKKGYKLVSVHNGKKKVKLTKKNGTYYFSISMTKLKDLKITYKTKKGKTRYLYNNEV